MKNVFYFAEDKAYQDYDQQKEYEKTLGLLKHSKLRRFTKLKLAGVYGMGDYIPGQDDGEPPYGAGE